MKLNYFIFCLLFTGSLFAQVNPIDFEPTGNGGDWTWTVFENDTNPPLEIITNPFPTGINTSQTVAKFTALQTGAPFAGCETMHGSDIGTFTLSADNAFVSIMVYKTTISDVGIKFVTPSSASTGEIKVANTLVDQWEELIFDFTGIIGEPSSTGIDQLVVFPDFVARGSDNIIYFDNIVFGDDPLGVNDNQNLTLKAYPNPTQSTLNLTSQSPLNSIEVYTILGQKVMQQEAIGINNSINVSNLKAGMYILSAKDNQGAIQHIKWVKE
ncbi:MAG: T9SS type A sorting domain-containing protein [Gilvibacter sp.]